jgi:hypothetical protein
MTLVARLRVYASRANEMLAGDLREAATRIKELTKFNDALISGNYDASARIAALEEALRRRLHAPVHYELCETLLGGTEADCDCQRANRQALYERDLALLGVTPNTASAKPAEVKE